MKKNQKHLLGKFVLALSGTIAIAICCFSPFFIVFLILIGLRFVIPYLDYILIPSLVLLLVLTVIFFYQWYQSKNKK